MRVINIFYILFIFVSLNIQAQSKTDTIYFNASWNKTTHDSASFYRIITKESSLFNVRDYYIGGKIQMEGFYSSIDPEVKEGHFKYYSIDGDIQNEGDYSNNKYEGLWKSYYAKGQVYSTNDYKNDKCNEFIVYYEDGKMKRKEEYQDSVMVKGTCYDESGKEIKFFPYYEKPQFRKDINKYLGEKIKYPETERSADIEGQVLVSFVVEKDGSVTDVKVKQGVRNGPGLEKEAVSVISSMPKWKPGLQDGQPVRVEFTVPINFRLK